MNLNSNITTLFSSLNNSGSYSFSLTDYASIKNGSYGKLLKAYYAKQAKETAEATDAAVKGATAEASDKTKKTEKPDTLTKLLNDNAKKTYTSDANYTATNYVSSLVDTTI